ncbi:hypothetical protein E4631_21615 [Hymenobacter sp. UV11]|uniref:hypothetical protein n=1 Tax=Hymenobacter sp. UV11 TaxID=1849735 RepID=UPI00105C22DC|nr:hypothetical protein [Hymenobacter sp. UV11]TDN36811.1 hypothetical protein A8B98_07415 [Hymenobacter sp. UV11]TFZ63656.1 hypothetical protein E4631_21615 [Hymenobacter sp. UV11]
MTPKQADRLRRQLTAIRRTLAAEKRKFGGYDDSRGLRYLPTRYYVQLADFTGGLTYLRWFWRSFPTDIGFADFLFEATIILFKQGKLKEASRQATATFRADRQLLAHFLGQPVPPAEVWENPPLAAEAYARYFATLGSPNTLLDVAEWVGELTSSEEFVASAEQFSDLHRQLHGEQDQEKRRQLLAQLYPPSPDSA